MTKSLVKSLLRPLPDDLYLRLRFFSTHGRLPQMRHPKAFSDYIVSRMINVRDPLMEATSDKFAAREFVSERIGDTYLASVYAVTDSLTADLFERLPNSFVAKASHGSQMVKIVRDKRSESFDGLRALIGKWVANDYYKVAREWVYRDLPRRVVIEEFLDDGSGSPPDDYKFYVFRGQVQFCHVDHDRFGDHVQSYYDRAWNVVDVRSKMPPGRAVERPALLVEMIRVAEALAAPFEFARIDLYEVRGKIVFGEITHFPMSGNKKFDPPSFDREIMRYLDARVA